MPDSLMMLMPMLTVALFVVSVGACVGSLINVLVYRLPLGLDVVRPTSRCPSCGTKLTWRENIPVFGWLLLRGKCRFCKSKISAEYPIVEALVAALFGLIFVLWYMVPGDAVLMGVRVGSIAPDWAANGPGKTWPAMVVLLTLMGSLVAMTIIDARTSTIPLVLTWVPAVVAVVFHTGHAIWIDSSFGPLTESVPGLWRGDGGERPSRWMSSTREIWTLATGGLGGWRFVGIALGGTIGLVVSNLMMRFGLLRQSFADYEAWEASELARMQADSDGSPEPPDGGEAPSAMWIQYPYARREMLKEIAFLGPPAGLAMLGGWLAVQWSGPATIGEGGLPQVAHLPLWLVVLGGVLMGYLIGGGVVWAVRIGGSLAFGKEAMGLGDVHLMAAVGACLGWIDPVIAFFLAAFVGVFYAVLAGVAGGKLKRAMPYGPFLAVATLLVVLGKPLIEIGLGRLLQLDGPLDLP